ncbi:MAG: pyruvate, phosphate dikinase [Candidatus Eisenbacteria bacterium]|nr:pyruvate, phosphate dikinase [Candidatus Eisenbacteria bacterium]
MSQQIYFFGEGKADGQAGMKDLLGGKGANLAEMTNAGVPVPPGFTIATTVCTAFTTGGRAPDGFAAEQETNLVRLEKVMGKKLGDPSDPLLVSVRSGAKFSMPGMMDTILNLGLTDQSVEGLATRTDNPRFAWDSYRRFLQMFGSVVMEIEKSRFEKRIEALKEARGIQLDTDLTVKDLQELVATYKKVVRDERGEDFPQDPRKQLDMSRDAVFRSWQNPRAIYYRKQNRIPDDLGTAVNVQAMVFGNMGSDSGTGVGFTRNPANGAAEFYGEYLTNAQGEDVVAGIRTPQPIAMLKDEMPGVYAQLREITDRLEKLYRDVQDFEFTIEAGHLFMLQTRTGKRNGVAAVKIAVDMVKEGLIDKKEAMFRVPPGDLDHLLHWRIDPTAAIQPIARGLPASPGATTGMVVFSADEAFRLGGEKKAVILVRQETNPDDIHGMDLARGILTATGGNTSHAAVVTRGMGKPCIVGCSDIRVKDGATQFTAGTTTITEGEWITIDGSSGHVYPGQVPLIEPTMSGEFDEFMRWADEFRTLKVRSNADVPRDALKAREFGAEGIGLCRTEHMFFGEERIRPVQEMILSANEFKRIEHRILEVRKAAERASGLESTRLADELAELESEFAGPSRGYLGSLAALLPFQREDFAGVFRAMDGYPVTIRLLDPPLHEFLPKREDLLVEVAVMKAKGERNARLAEAETLLHRVEALHEFNPMLGHRGCRLGITYPEITRMQTRAIFEAAVLVKKEGVTVLPEIMIPLVGAVTELTHQKALVIAEAERVMAETGVTIEYLVGTMIEVPRAALTAGQVAMEAQFFSFGTNDLTQMTFGYSRDDIGKFLHVYLDGKILPEDPFVVLDEIGVGDLMRLATERGRAARPDLKLGICGEHGGEPSAVAFCHQLGFEYVSCSPYRVPIARLAAARAALSEAGLTAQSTA